MFHWVKDQGKKPLIIQRDTDFRLTAYTTAENHDSDRSEMNAIIDRNKLTNHGIGSLLKFS
jgi:hypothetical protein